MSSSTPQTLPSRLASRRQEWTPTTPPRPRGSWRPSAALPRSPSVFDRMRGLSGAQVELQQGGAGASIGHWCWCAA
eukprot:8765874-Pyramimonas_sp.AAC.1